MLYYYFNFILFSTAGEPQNNNQQINMLIASHVALTQSVAEIRRALLGGPALAAQPPQNGQPAVPPQPAVPGLVANFNGLSANFNELSANFNELSANFNELSARVDKLDARLQRASDFFFVNTHVLLTFPPNLLTGKEIIDDNLRGAGVAEARMQYPPLILPNMTVVPPLDPTTLIRGANTINGDAAHPVRLNTAAAVDLLKNPLLQANWTADAVRILARHYRFPNEPANDPDSRRVFVRRLFLGGDM
jgi:hypothetical protein